MATEYRYLFPLEIGNHSFPVGIINFYILASQSVNKFTQRYKLSVFDLAVSNSPFKLTLPRMEKRHFTTGTGEDLFVRNMKETRRMEYTLYNALGSEPSAWRDGKPLATVSLTIPADKEMYAGAFWPWDETNITDLVHSRPLSFYYVEAWDCYHNGKFMYVRYIILSL